MGLTWAANLVPLIDQGKIEEAKAALQAALSTLVETRSVHPLPALRATEKVVGDLRGVLEDNPGSSEVRVKLQEPGRTTLMQLDKRLAVTPSAALYASLKALLGPGCLS